MNIQYPKSGALTEEMADAIEQEFSDFEKALYSFDYNTHDYGYQNYIDVNSFVDYFIINEFTQNYDAGYLSTYLYKDIGGKYKMVIWDFNSACNNYQDDHYRERLPDCRTRPGRRCSPGMRTMTGGSSTATACGGRASSARRI